MNNLFEYLDDLEAEDQKEVPASEDVIVESLKKDNESYSKGGSGASSYEEAIRVSGMTRGDYIRNNSYVGKRINVDFRSQNKSLENKENEVVKKKDDSNAKELNMNPRMLIVDGSSLLSTGFYGTARDLMFAKTKEQKELAYSKLLQTKDGIYTNGVYKFFQILMPMIKKYGFTHIAVALDRSRANTFRKKEIYDDYKANRSETPYPLKSQFKLLEEILREANISVFTGERYEADDFAGTISTKFESEIDIVLYSKDADYLQLVTENTRLWRTTSKSNNMYSELNLKQNGQNVPFGIFEYTPEYVKHFEGLNPMQIVDAKAIEGDKSDNIPGVKGVGETASRPLLRKYETVEGIYEILDMVADDVKAQKELAKVFKEELGIKRSPIKNLLEQKESAFLSKRLAKIKTDIPELDDLKLEDLKVSLIDYNKLNEQFLKYEMKSLVE